MGPIRSGLGRGNSWIRITPQGSISMDFHGTWMQWYWVSGYMWPYYIWSRRKLGVIDPRWLTFTSAVSTYFGFHGTCTQWYLVRWHMCHKVIGYERTVCNVQWKHINILFYALRNFSTFVVLCVYRRIQHVFSLIVPSFFFQTLQVDRLSQQE